MGDKLKVNPQVPGHSRQSLMGTFFSGRSTSLACQIPCSSSLVSGLSAGMQQLPMAGWPASGMHHHALTLFFASCPPGTMQNGGLIECSGDFCKEAEENLICRLEIGQQLLVYTTRSEKGGDSDESFAHRCVCVDVVFQSFLLFLRYKISGNQKGRKNGMQCPMVATRQSKNSTPGGKGERREGAKSNKRKKERNHTGQ